MMVDIVEKLQLVRRPSRLTGVWLLFNSQPSGIGFRPERFYTSGEAELAIAVRVGEA